MKALIIILLIAAGGAIVADVDLEKVAKDIFGAGQAAPDRPEYSATSYTKEDRKQYPYMDHDSNGNTIGPVPASQNVDVRGLKTADLMAALRNAYDRCRTSRGEEQRQAHTEYMALKRELDRRRAAATRYGYTY